MSTAPTWIPCLASAAVVIMSESAWTVSDDASCLSATLVLVFQRNVLLISMLNVASP